MKTPKRPVNLVDLLSDIEDLYTVVFLVIDHNGTRHLYDKDDVGFVDPELFECMVESYDVDYLTNKKARVHIILKGGSA